MCVGMDQRIGVDHHPDVPFPEDEIAALERRIFADVGPELVALHVAVAGAWDVAGGEGGLDQARAVDPKRRVPAPEIGDVEMQLRDGGWVFEWPVEGAEVFFGDEAEVCFEEFLTFVDDFGTGIEWEMKGHLRFKGFFLIRMCAKGRDTVGHASWASIGKSTQLDIADISVIAQDETIELIGFKKRDGFADKKLSIARAWFFVVQVIKPCLMWMIHAQIGCHEPN